MNFSRSWLSALARRAFLWLITGNHFGEPDVIPLYPRGRGIRKMVARAIWANRREIRGARIMPKYSYDKVIERRERKAERMRQPASLFLVWKREVNE